MSRSPKERAAIARENGKKGGRPRKVEAEPGDRAEHLAMLQQAGPPPIGDPLKLNSWLQTIAAHDSWAHITGVAVPSISEEIRKSLRVAQQGVPLDVIAEAQHRIAEDAGQLDANTGPGTVDVDDLEDEDDGSDGPANSIAG